MADSSAAEARSSPAIESLSLSAGSPTAPTFRYPEPPAEHLLGPFALPDDHAPSERPRCAGAGGSSPPARPAPLLGVDAEDPAERDPLVRGVLAFLLRTRAWPQRLARGRGRTFHTRELEPEALRALPDAQRGQAGYFPVRDLCVDVVLQNLDEAPPRPARASPPRRRPSAPDRVGG